MDLLIFYYTEDLKINNRLCWWATDARLQMLSCRVRKGVPIRAFSLLFHDNPASWNYVTSIPNTVFSSPIPHPVPRTLANPGCRVTVKSRIPSRYFAFSRIPHYISDPERIPFLTLVLVSLWQRDNTLLKSAVSIRFDTRKTYAFRIKLTAKTVDEDPASCKRWISRKEI